MRLSTGALMSVVVDRLRGVDDVVASAIGDGAGSALHEVPEESGTFYHTHDSRVRQ